MDAPYAHTTVRRVPTDRFAEMRALAKAALRSRLQWRHHAVGMLQAYLAEDRAPEVRIHIWHPDLVRTNLAIDGGRPHDHRFRLRSTVLAGAVDHEELLVVPCADPFDADWTEYTVQHARAGAAPLVPTGRHLHAVYRAGTIHEGHTYEFQAGEFHRSGVARFAVTLVTKLAQITTPARVLFPRGCAPVFGVTAIDETTADRYVQQACAALGGEVL